LTVLIRSGVGYRRLVDDKVDGEIGGDVGRRAQRDLQAPLPLHAPPQPVKVDPLAGVAVSVTVVPLA